MQKVTQSPFKAWDPVDVFSDSPETVLSRGAFLRISRDSDILLKYSGIGQSVESCGQLSTMSPQEWNRAEFSQELLKPTNPVESSSGSIQIDTGRSFSGFTETVESCRRPLRITPNRRIL